MSGRFGTGDEGSLSGYIDQGLLWASPFIPGAAGLYAAKQIGGHVMEFLDTDTPEEKRRKMLVKLLAHGFDQITAAAMADRYS